MNSLCDFFHNHVFVILTTVLISVILQFKDGNDYSSVHGTLQGTSYGTIFCVSGIGY